MNREGLIIASVGTALTALLVWGTVEAAKENAVWEAWAVGHCKMVGIKAPTTASTLGFSAKGEVFMASSTIPERKIYACDDGITYER